MTITALGVGPGYLGWRLAPRSPKNFYLEATFTTGSCGGADLYGLVFRAKDYSSGFGYYFEITCDGRYSLSRWDDSGKATILGKSTNAAILPGANKTNHFGVMANNDSLKLYANGKLLQEVKDKTFLSSGYIGPFIAGQTGGFTVEMDEIAYWQLP